MTILDYLSRKVQDKRADQDKFARPISTVLLSILDLGFLAFLFLIDHDTQVIGLNISMLTSNKCTVIYILLIKILIKS